MFLGSNFPLKTSSLFLFSFFFFFFLFEAASVTSLLVHLLFVTAVKITFKTGMYPFQINMSVPQCQCLTSPVFTFEQGQYFAVTFFVFVCFCFVFSYMPGAAEATVNDIVNWTLKQVQYFYVQCSLPLASNGREQRNS